MIGRDISRRDRSDACAACHPIGRARSWHRSKEEWALLVTMHRGYFAVAEFQSFYRREPALPVQPPPRGQTLSIAASHWIRRLNICRKNIR